MFYFRMRISMELYVLMSLVLMSTISAHVLDLEKGVIVHLFEWKWLDIAKECEDFLAPNGYAGVQISPPNENIIITQPVMRPWWERYQPISYKLKTRSGTEEELQEMLTRCNKKGIRIFADAVLNHMTGPAPPGALGTAGSTADYGNYHYKDVEFTELDFHVGNPPCGVHNYNNEFEVRFCELDSMRDLDQSKTYVKAKQIEYLNKLIDMGVAGFRIDAARHMWPSDLKRIFDRLDDLSVKHGFRLGTRPLIYQEAIDYGSHGEAIRWTEYSDLGLVTDFRYIGEMGDTFLGKRNLDWLKGFATTTHHLPSDASVVFVDNHDTERKPKENELNYKTFRAYKMAIAFMLAYPWGTPQIMSGYNFEDKDKGGDEGPPHDDNYNIKSPHPIEGNLCKNGWTCQHRWRQIYNMVRFHNVVAGTEVTDFQSDGDKQAAFCRGKKGFIAFNTNPHKEMKREFQTCLPKGKYCDVISGNLIDNECSKKTIEVGEDGKALIDIPEYVLHHKDIERDNVVAIHVKAKILDESEMKPKSEIERWCNNNENHISFCDEKKGFIGFSKKEYTPNEKMKTCLPKGTYCDVVSGSLLNNVCTGRTVQVASDGTGTFNNGPVERETDQQKNYKLVVFHIGAKIVEKEIVEKDKEDKDNKDGENGKSTDHTSAVTSQRNDPLAQNKQNIIGTSGKRGLFGGKKRKFIRSRLNLLKRETKSNAIGNKNPICDKVDQLITNRDGSLALSAFVTEEEDFDMLKIITKTGKIDMISDLVLLIN